MALSLSEMMLILGAVLPFAGVIVPFSLRYRENGQWPHALVTLLAVPLAMFLLGLAAARAFAPGEIQSYCAGFVRLGYLGYFIPVAAIYLTEAVAREFKFRVLGNRRTYRPKLTVRGWL